MKETKRVGIERLKELLTYDPSTGVFHSARQRGARRKDRVVGCLNAGGYLITCIDYKQFYLHRLAWFYMTGEWPEAIDHRDGNRANNVFSNLRAADWTDNGANKKTVRNGLKGAYPHGSGFRSRIKLRGVDLCLGTFRTEEEAHEVYVSKAKELFGEFARAA
jgi:hypothetical protein